MMKPAMVVMRAESRPREEKREIKKATTRPMMPVFLEGYIMKHILEEKYSDKSSSMHHKS